MKILFVFYNYGSGISLHGGIALLSALAKQQGHETKLLHFHKDLLKDTPNIYLPIVKEYNPDIIAFTSTDFEYKQICDIAWNIYNELGKDRGVPLFVLGGKSAIEMATKDISKNPFHLFFVGEAELPWTQLLKTYPVDWDKIPSTWARSMGTITKNLMGDVVTDLDNLPFPAFDIFDVKKIVEGKSGWFSLQFSRGCLYNCTYCYVTADKFQMFDKKKGDGRYGMEKYLRNNSVDYAMRFMENLCTKYPIRVFNLDDELLISIEMQKGRGYSWWLDFCKAYKERILQPFKVEFCANGRINLMNEEVIKAMADAGCRECRMGFESGSFRIRKDILDKPITNQQMKEVYALCDKHGLRTTSFTMLGNPTETEEDIWESVKMTAELKPYLIRLTFCYPFENTRLWFYCKEHNLIKEDMLYKQHGYFEESVIKLPIDDQRLMAYRFLFPWFVNTLILKDMDLVEEYVAIIEAYKDQDFRNQYILEKVIELDKHLSELCGDSEHYCYFANNTAYFHCKNKMMKDGKNI